MPQPIRNWHFEPDPVPPEAGSTGDERSGTSFAAPHIAARLLDQALVHSVCQPGAQAATGRTLAALASLGWPGRS
jgi:hypothetical protein